MAGKTDTPDNDGEDHRWAQRDDLFDAVRDTVVDMATDPNTSYVKATHVERRLDDDTLPDNATTLIGHRLSLMSDDGDLELWSPGNAGSVWRITVDDAGDL